MSKLEIIDLHLKAKHSHKLYQGGNVQLTHDDLHNAICCQPNTELHMERSNVTQIMKAHKNGKGIRLTQNKIVGGKLNVE